MSKFFTTLALASLLTTVATVYAGRDEALHSAATQSATPACCGDTCQKMGGKPVTAGDKGKVTCAMGGSCCIKPSIARATPVPDVGGKNMGR